MILGLDLGTARTGWCRGVGDCVPRAGTWTLPEVDKAEPDYGLLLRTFEHHVRGIWAQGAPSHVLYEAPLILQRDLGRLHWVRGIYGLGSWLEWWCACHRVPCYESPLRVIKKELAGFHLAGKTEMVAAARAVGVTLPAGKAEEDAADAFGAWLIGVRFYAPQHKPEWDRRLQEARGGLL